MKFAVTAAAVAALMLIATQGAHALPECNPANLDQCNPSNLGQNGCDDEPLSASTCSWEFARSPAARTCYTSTGWVVDAQKCKIRAGCSTRAEEGWIGSGWDLSEVTARCENVHTLRNCDGRLKLGLC